MFTPQKPPVTIRQLNITPDDGSVSGGMTLENMGRGNLILNQPNAERVFDNLTELRMHIQTTLSPFEHYEFAAPSADKLRSICYLLGRMKNLVTLELDTGRVLLSNDSCSRLYHEVVHRVDPYTMHFSYLIHMLVLYKLNLPKLRHLKLQGGLVGNSSILIRLLSLCKDTLEHLELVELGTTPSGWRQIFDWLGRDHECRSLMKVQWEGLRKNSRTAP
ncbi:hypothetical protein EJ08DRAFT_375553 [Tothia fuscella]|uniref:Uncharacterized protein n=1 Tax=Tothia fuscella TaxID=1048955 RepID=A0A9P4NM26_9PEZI|nr:hypothetical protein EJ08DRAFT_375553 [Tothia fuscella]